MTFLTIGYLVVLATPTVQAQVAINKSFSPISVNPGQNSTLTVTLTNPGSVPATSTAVTDNLPSGLVVSSVPSVTNTCGGTVTATAGSSSVSLSGGIIPAAVAGMPGSCQFTAQVMGSSAGTYVNTIPVSAVSSSQGTNLSSTSATLTVAPFVAVTGTQSFSIANIHGQGSARLTITLNNSNSVPLLSVGLTNSLASPLIIASTPAVAATCGGTVTATAGSSSLSLSGGSIAASGSCTISVDLTATHTTVVDTNVASTIAASNITTLQGITNTSAISGTIRAQSGAQIAKAFSPATITAGGTSTLTLTLRNFNANAITSADFTDAMPTNVTVTATGTNTCAGSTSFTSTQAQLTGGTIPAAPSGTGSGSCAIRFTVTSATPGVHTNSVPAGSVNSIAYNSTSTTLTVNSAVAVSKVFSGTSVQTNVVTLTITLSNASASAATITAFQDNLTTMGSGFTVAASPAASTTCGGTVSATSGSTLISKSDGTIPAGGSCTVTVPVQIAGNSSIGNRTNTVAIGALQTSAGNNETAATRTINVARAANVSKAFSPSTGGAGAAVRLTMTISHTNGAVAFTGMGISDSLPAGHTISSTPNLTNTCGGSVTAVGGTSTITLAGGSLATGSTSCQIAVDVRLPTGMSGTATNTIPANTLTTDQEVTYNQAATANITTIDTTVTLNKGFSPANIPPGGTSTVTILFLNNNASAVNLTGVALTDVLPVGLTIASAANASFTGGGCSGGTITAVSGGSSISISGASVNANAVCSLTVNVTSNFVGNLVNTIPAGSLTSNELITNTNQPEATLSIAGTADISVTKTDGVSSVIAGDSTTYTIQVSNAGPSNVAGIVVTDTQPSAATFTWSCAASAGSSCTQASGTGSINTTVSVLVGGTATFTVTAQVNGLATGTLTNTVTVTPPDTISDPDLSNNSASDVDTITPSPDLTLTKSHTGNFIQGQTGVSFTISVTNSGNSPTSGSVTMTDTVPNGLTATAAAGTGWTCQLNTPGAGQVQCTRNDALTQGSSYPAITLTVNVASNAAASLTNVVVISGGNEPTGNTSNNTANDAVTILTPPNVVLVKSVLPLGEQSPGTDLAYTITLTNSGGANAHNLTIRDAVPDNTDFKVGSETTSLGTSGLTIVIEFSNDYVESSPGSATWTYVPVSGGGGAPAGYDRSVRAVRWRVTAGNLSPTAPNNTASIGLTVRIR